MIGKSNILKKHENPKREIPDIEVGPIMAAYLLGYLKSQNGDDIAEGEDIESLYIGSCLKMGINPVEDISELFQALFGLGEEADDDKPLQYYA